MFKIGDKAKVLEDIVRKDGRSRAVPGDVVEITQTFQTKNAQVVAIKFLDNRLPMIDIVLFNDSHVLKKLTDETSAGDSRHGRKNGGKDYDRKQAVKESFTPRYGLREGKTPRKPK